MKLWEIFCLLTVFMLLFFLHSCSESPKNKPDTEWIVLFNGKNFDGWRGLGRDSVPEKHWIVENGSIRKVESGNVPLQADGQPLAGGDLMTIDTFRDFEFYFEWKISEGSNSGVKYNVSEEMSQENGPSYAALGFEYQILDDNKHIDAENPTHRTASLYDLIEAKNKLLKPVGEFNESRIFVSGNHGEHWLNGIKVLEYDLQTTKFDSLFQASKYKQNPEFPKKRSGHIVLQDHTDDVWFRNLKIRRIKIEK